MQHACLRVSPKTWHAFIGSAPLLKPFPLRSTIYHSFLIIASLQLPSTLRAHALSGQVISLQQHSATITLKDCFEGSVDATARNGLELSSAHCYAPEPEVSFQYNVERWTEILNPYVAVAKQLLTETQHSIYVAQPAIGRPPAPKISVSPTQTRRVAKGKVESSFSEDYLPYDLSIRDWRFGQYPSWTLAQIAEFRDHWKAQKSLDAYLPSLSSQCAAALLTLRKQGAEALSSTTDWLNLACTRLLEYRQRVESHVALELKAVYGKDNLQPFFLQPMYVRYETPDGFRFLFNIEEARKWKLITPILPVQPDTPSDDPMDAIHSFTKLFMNTSVQVQNGIAILQDWWDNSQVPHVASGLVILAY